jgi:hypothetical protein
VCKSPWIISVDILLKATGNAPIMKKKKWAVDPERKIGWITEFMKKYLKLDRSEYLVRFGTATETFGTSLYTKRNEKHMLSCNPCLVHFNFVETWNSYSKFNHIERKCTLASFEVFFTLFPNIYHCVH